jgi:transposase
MILAVQPDPQLDSVGQLVAVVAEPRAEVDRLRADNEQLRAENGDLRRRLGVNSSNSSKPASSDGLARPRAQPVKGQSGRRRGNQPGASGSTLELVTDPDQVLQHRPDRCAGLGCGAELADRREYGRQRRQVVESPVPWAVVVEHQLWSRSSVPGVGGSPRLRCRTVCPAGCRTA